MTRKKLVTARARALRSLEKCENRASSSAVVLKFRVERIDAHIALLDSGSSRALTWCTLKLLAATHAAAIAELRIAELDTFAVSSTGRALGEKPATSCDEVEDKELRKERKAAFMEGRPPDMLLCHQCDNHKCFNVEHWFWGTKQDNARDAAIKGRNRAKLKSTSVAEYLELRRAKLMRSLAKHQRRIAERMDQLVSISRDLRRDDPSNGFRSMTG